MLAVMEKTDMRPVDGSQRLDQRWRSLMGRVAQNRDSVAFADLFDHFAPRLKSFMMRKGASSELAEDLLQETMIAVWTKAASYDPAKGAVTTWIFTIARNLRIDRFRRDGNMPTTELGDYDEPSDAPVGEELLGRKQEDGLVVRALEHIPQDQREILILSFVEDMPQSEIATRLALPLGTVKSRMRLAYGHLRRLLETGF